MGDQDSSQFTLTSPSPWRRAIADAIRSPDELVEVLQLPHDLRRSMAADHSAFPLLVPRSFVARMTRGDADDPLLRQVLPLEVEQESREGFTDDPLDERSAERAPGLLQKYSGRALLLATGVCAMHCRYCFRRHCLDAQSPRGLEEWTSALEAVAGDASLHEIILSGGDPLCLDDERLSGLVERLARILHLRRLRVHSRLPIAVPERVTDDLIDGLTGSRLTPILVVQANHAQELGGDCAAALRTLVRAGIVVLNQSVLLRGVNDSVPALTALCEGLIDLGVIPYYLHQLDPVAGAAHFDVPEAEGRRLVAAIRTRLPGYAVPTYVREVAGEAGKRALL